MLVVPQKVYSLVLNLHGRLPLHLPYYCCVMGAYLIMEVDIGLCRIIRFRVFPNDY